MITELFAAIHAFIKEFGFPIFVALSGLFLFAAVFRNMTARIDAKDDNFAKFVENRDAQTSAMVERHSKRVDDLINDHHGRVDAIVKNHNQLIAEMTDKNSLVLRENTLAINKMRSALESRTEYVREQTALLQGIAEDTHTKTNIEG